MRVVPLFIGEPGGKAYGGDEVSHPARKDSSSGVRGRVEGMAWARNKWGGGGQYYVVT